MNDIHNLHVLNAKEKAEIGEYLFSYYGISSLPSVLLLSKDNNLFTISEKLRDIPIKNMRVNSLGLYLGEWRHRELRLSMEGAQFWGLQATKNILSLSASDARKWLTGENLDVQEEDLPEGFKLVSYLHPKTNKLDFLGCGRLRERVLANYVPKARRVKELII
jgi:NOL1/NOP2/fmu family ribosome biogenesis protein